jgi:hypothetical protein
VAGRPVVELTVYSTTVTTMTVFVKFALGIKVAGNIRLDTTRDFDLIRHAVDNTYNKKKITAF